ncbi:MAG: radical SAM family heme chaperone HemW [Bacteroidaceae bacterium]|nr:radical SAM family heme chaperone HemW [Bacteroidaceae bacterium]
MAGIYLHIPFCKRRCIYCDFFSSVDNTWRDKYIEALCRELEMRRAYIGGEQVETIYIGGGTPSLLTWQELDRIFSCIYKVYDVTEDAEVTLETNPDDLSISYVKALRKTSPVNRISMGVQTFDDNRLRFLQRRHTSAQVIEVVNRCREEGFENISIDLIYGLPGETLVEWESDLRVAIDLGVPHLSAYSLTYEEGTILWRMREEGLVYETDEELSAQMYFRLVNYLIEKGYEHYEISNFCLPGMLSRHNSSYWKGIPYIGCGAAAHSYDGCSRQWNVASIPCYIKGIVEEKPVIEREVLNLYTRYNDFLVTRLRTRWGIDLHLLRMEFGQQLYAYCLRMARRHINQGLLCMEDYNLRLTNKGVFISDSIICDLLWCE